MSTWHPSVAQVWAWVEGTVGPLDTASIDQHIPLCAVCRTVASESPALPELEETWQAIRDRLEPQRLNLVGQMLVRMGMSPHNAFLTSSTPSLSDGWFAGIAFALLFAVVAGAMSGTRGLAIFLFVAPLAPLAGIAFAFSRDTDPLFELTLAAPYSKFRLLMWRSAAILATTVPLTVMAALIAGMSWWEAGVWLIPALAFCTITLALATWVEPAASAMGIGLVWFVIQSIGFAREIPAFAYANETLVVYTLAGLIAGVVIVMRRTATVAWRIR
jgi:hypothetical protein